MKIGVIAHLKHGIRQPFAGGLEMHTHMLVAGLQARGHTVTLFAARHSDPALHATEICDEMSFVSNFFEAEHTVYRKLMQRLRMSDFDLIHNNSLHYLTVGLAPQLPMPMVTTLHTPPFWEIEGSMRLCEGANAGTNISSSAYIAVSDYIARAWAPIATIEQTIVNGIDLDHFAFHSQPNSSPYLAWCGRIVPEKGLHLAIDAARRAFSNLHIAGPVSDPHYFNEMIEPMLGPDIIYRGHLDHDAVMRLVRGARAFVCTPMWDEPYGLVIAEALACGTPVATFARGAVGELIDESCGLAVPPDDVASLSEAIIRVQRLPRKACRQRAESIAGIDAMIGAYLVLYNRMLQRRALPDELSLPGLQLPSSLDSETLLAVYRSRLPQLFSSVPVPAEPLTA